MKIHMKALLLVAAAGSTLGSGGCSLWPWHHSQPKSSFKIIDEGDPNPFIIDAPTRAGTITRKVDVYTN